MNRAMGAAVVLAAALGGSLTTLALQQKVAQSGRTPQFESDEVKVWRSLILPHQPLAMHHHDHGRVLVALSGGTMNIVDPEGRADVHVWETGKAYWLPAMAPGTVHSDVNAGEKPIEVMVVELQNDKYVAK